MFLIFGLKRPDVLALGDAGLQRAAKMLYRFICYSR
jgi:DNA-3-methyladenine glycosylase II